MNLRNLPMAGKEAELVSVLSKKQVAIISAETGSGKTTISPILLYIAGFSNGKIIGVTEPRRLAASYGATQVAVMTETALGDLTGYQVRFEEVLGPNIKIKFATEGIFLQEAKTDPLFSRYSVLMLDEVHEMTIEMTILLGLVKQAMEQRPDFKIVIASATINIQQLKDFFGDKAGLVECSGRNYPLEQIFEEEDPSSRFIDRYRAKMTWTPVYEMPEYVADVALEAIKNGERGDILVFLAGFEDLKRAKERFESLAPSNCIAHLAYGDMNLEDLRQLLEESLTQRVIFATNVAETSITIPGVRLVIDSGKVKKDFFNPETGIVELREIKTSRASSTQRAGRSARMAPGRCRHLFTKRDYESRQEYDTPAIQRSSLAGVLLILAKIGIENFREFPLIHQPDHDQIEKACDDLCHLGAITPVENNGLFHTRYKITEYGECLSKFPLDPNLAHLIVRADENDALIEMITFLAMYQARVLPKPKPDEHPTWPSLVKDCESDPEVLLTLWDLYYQNNFQYEWAKDVGLRARAMNEARQIRGQLLDIARYQQMQPSSSECDYHKLKKALIRALPDQIAFPYGNHSYTRPLTSGEAYIHPSSRMMSGVFESVWSFELRQTTKLFMLCCMPVTVDELKKYCSDKIETTYRKEAYFWASNVRICEQVSFLGHPLSHETVSEYERGGEETDLISQTLTPEEYLELLDLLKEREHLTELAKIKHERLVHEAMMLLDRMPILPNFPLSSEVYNLRDQIRHGLPLTFSSLSYCLTQERIDNAQGLLFQLAELMQREIKKREEFLERLKQEREQRTREEAEYEAERKELEEEEQQAIRISAQLLQLYVEEYLNRCPICYGQFADDQCSCVRHADLPKSLQKVQGDVDLVSLESENGQLLGRVYYSKPNGSPPKVIREIHPVTESFEDIEVTRISM